MAHIPEPIGRENNEFRLAIWDYIHGGQSGDGKDKISTLPCFGCQCELSRTGDYVVQSRLNHHFDTDKLTINHFVVLCPSCSISFMLTALDLDVWAHAVFGTTDAFGIWRMYQPENDTIMTSIDSKICGIELVDYIHRVDDARDMIAERYRSAGYSPVEVDAILNFLTDQAEMAPKHKQLKVTLRRDDAETVPKHKPLKVTLRHDNAEMCDNAETRDGKRPAVIDLTGTGKPKIIRTEMAACTKSTTDLIVDEPPA